MFRVILLGLVILAGGVSTPSGEQNPQGGVSNHSAGPNDINSGTSQNLGACLAAPTGGTDDAATLAGYTASGLGAVLTTSVVTSPACTLTGGQITENLVTANTHWAQKTITFSETATTYTYTIWVQRVVGNRNALPFIFNSGSTANIAGGVDLTLCTQNVAPVVTGGFFSAPTITATNAGSGWCKIALSFTGAVDTSIIVGVALMVGTGASGVYNGDGNSAIAAWGSDFRAGTGP